MTKLEELFVIEKLTNLTSFTYNDKFKITTKKLVKKLSQNKDINIIKALPIIFDLFFSKFTLKTKIFFCIT